MREGINTINTHLPNLIDCTKFNIELLTGLISTNLITASERDEIVRLIVNALH